MLDEVAGRKLAFLRLAGEAMIDLSPPDGIEIDTRIVYRAKPLELDGRVVDAMRSDGGVALLHSGEAAKRLRMECERAHIDRGKIAIAALGPRIAELAGEGWQSVHTATNPADAELLALAKALCQ